MANSNQQQKFKPESGGLRLDMGPGTAHIQDPTALTTAQLIRENFWLRELLQEQLSGLEQRMRSADKAVQLLQAFADRTPTTMDVQHQVTQLREVVMEKFEGVKNTFAQNATALTAALDAQTKQAIATNDNTTTANNKMEESFTKQIDNIGGARKDDMKSVDDKIDGIKERLTIIESKTSISDPSTAITLAKLDATVQRLTSTTDFGSGKSAGQIALWALIVGGLGLIFGVVSVVSFLMKVAPTVHP